MITQLEYQLLPILYVLIVLSAFICGGIVKGGLVGVIYDY